MKIMKGCGLLKVKLHKTPRTKIISQAWDLLQSHAWQDVFVDHQDPESSIRKPKMSTGC